MFVDVLLGFVCASGWSPKVSKQLPLIAVEPYPGGVPHAFVSGLSVYADTVVISYSAGDRDARALVMKMDDLDAMFKCETLEVPPSSDMTKLRPYGIEQYIEEMSKIVLTPDEEETRVPAIMAAYQQQR
eukprot:gnl/TRDRNA2_/TRDRNA2_172440_c3_seq2.p1 gnl/TRDRNA2_/TRDRNA2_172440_c3~~gnl/TRDRNA2_/TRDRNA2_172440_c3_seq2.p1  ORF type:complete len:129 (-),score=24.33 gnl/TRDRNA2_/TRDRNA2_172440_c3_seq2:298-684(-)